MKPISTPYGDGRRLWGPFIFEFDGTRYLIYAGFHYDGASVPRPLWPLTGHPMRSSTEAASLIHDFFYRTGLVSRKDADRAFLERMEADGVKHAWTYWLAVRWFGWIHYKPRQGAFGRRIGGKL